MAKKVFFGVVVIVVLAYLFSKRRQEDEQERQEAERAVRSQANSRKGYETLDTGKYGKVTFKRETYEELQRVALPIYEDLKRSGGHWNATWAYEYVDGMKDDVLIWYLGYIISRMRGGGSVSSQARKENWRAGTWFDVRYADKIERLGNSFVEKMQRVGW